MGEFKLGTGKTTAFLLPAIQNTLTESPRKGQVSILIMSPTRELALQIAAEASRLVARLARPLEVQYVDLKLVIPVGYWISISRIMLTSSLSLVPRLEALQKRVI